MASIRKRNGKWQVQVRRQGHGPVSRSFINKADAQAWARKTERDIDCGGIIPERQVDRETTVGDILKRYLTEVSAKKRGAYVEGYVIRRFISHKIGSMKLPDASAWVVATYRDNRLRSVKPATVRRELAVLQHCFEVARREWGYQIDMNPVAQIAMPQVDASRERRLEAGELDRLLDGCRRGRTALLAPLIEIAVETGMRRGELVSARWCNVDLEARTLYLPMTKNGLSRTIPLTPRAVAILCNLPRTSSHVFPISGNAIRLAWERLKRRVGIEDLRFHDLRHEAISRFFEMGLSVPEVALISGHRDTRMLFRYTHLRAEDVAKKLAG